VEGLAIAMGKHRARQHLKAEPPEGEALPGGLCSRARRMRRAGFVMDGKSLAFCARQGLQQRRKLHQSLHGCTCGVPREEPLERETRAGTR